MTAHFGALHHVHCVHCGDVRFGVNIWNNHPLVQFQGVRGNSVHFAVWDVDGDGTGRGVGGVGECDGG